MRKIKITRGTFFIFLFFQSALDVRAQRDPYCLQFNQMKSFFNPAAAGDDGLLRMTQFYYNWNRSNSFNSQFVPFGLPSSGVLIAMPVPLNITDRALNRLGLQLSYLETTNGNIRDVYYGIAVNTNFKFPDGHEIAIGGEPAWHKTRLTYSRQSGYAFGGNAGIEYRNENLRDLHVGVAYRHVTPEYRNLDVRGSQLRLSMKPFLYMHTSVAFKDLLTEGFAIVPSLVVRYAQNQTGQEPEISFQCNFSYLIVIDAAPIISMKGTNFHSPGFIVGICPFNLQTGGSTSRNSLRFAFAQATMEKSPTLWYGREISMHYSFKIWNAGRNHRFAE